MSFYNLVENAEVYGYPRGGEPLKNNRLTEKKNGWRPWNGRKLIETTELNSQKGHIPQFYYNNRQVHLNKKASDFKSKTLRMYLWKMA